MDSTHAARPSLFPSARNPLAWDHWPQIQSYIHLTQQDIDRLAAAQDFFVTHKRAIIEKTVDALLEEPFLQQISHRESTRERLEGVVDYYLDSLVCPTIDDEYIASRTHIGQTHIRVKVAPEWVTATCILLIQMIFELMPPETDPQLIIAAIKRLLFDNIFIVGEYVRGMLDLQRQNEHLTRTNAQLSALVTIDPLTNCVNHRAANTALDREISHSDENLHTFAVLFLDIDHFKAINDGFGHMNGDQVLIEFSEQVQSVLRAQDILGRWGGEEFIIILPRCPRGQALEISERIRAHIAQHLFRVGGGMHVTCSIGGACYPQDAASRDTLVQSADRAMYLAKNLGRNQVRMIGDLALTTIEKDEIRNGSREDVMLVATVDALVESLVAHDAYTGYHVETVGFLARQLANQLGSNEEESKMIWLAGRLHDLGKLAIPSEILSKTTTLTPEEWKKMRTHPVIGAEIIQKIPALRPLSPLIRAHHEHWDGNGYPDRLKAESIPLGSRIIAVVDAFDAMTTDRSYSSARPVEWALEELQRSAGTQFDEQIVSVFCQFYRRDRAA